jgi:ATP synthase protein I
MKSSTAIDADRDRPDSAAHEGKPDKRWQDWQDRDGGGDGQAQFVALTKAEAGKLRAESPGVSPWRVLTGQLAAGIVVALVAWGWTGRQSVGWSALYGALAVVVPGAVFARGLMGKVSSMNPGAAVAGFFLWEMVKIALTVAMFFAASRLVPGLSWPAMLVGLIVTMKIVWLALMFVGRGAKKL